MKIIICFLAVSLLASCQSFLLGDLPPQQKPEEKGITQPMGNATPLDVRKSVVIQSRNAEPNKNVTGDERDVEPISSDTAVNSESEDIIFQRDALDEIGDFFSQLFGKEVKEQSSTVSRKVVGGSKAGKSPTKINSDTSVARSQDMIKSNSADENPSVRGKVERRYSAAYGVYYPLAKKGHAFAQYEMALMHLHGYGVNPDLKKAESWFRKADDIDFDISVAHRKYYQYGSNLIGLEHGDGAKMVNLPLLMAQERPKMWSETTHRYFYLHHLHHKVKHKWLDAKDYVGVTVEYLRSPSGTDSWHSRKGYTGVPKAVEGFLHEKTSGQVARITHYF